MTAQEQAMEKHSLSRGKGPKAIVPYSLPFLKRKTIGHCLRKKLALKGNLYGIVEAFVLRICLLSRKKKHLFKGNSRELGAV